VIVPVTLATARRFVGEHHRHNGAPRGWLFGAGLELDGELRGVVVVGRPLARALQDGATVEILRVCTLGDRNAATRLYGAACRAASALGYRRAVTYTLRSEPGSSLRGAGFRKVAELEPRATWASAGRGRYDATIFGDAVLPAEPRDRWERPL
jgi:hypothetical protein